MTNYSQVVVVRAISWFFKQFYGFSRPKNISGMAEVRVVKFCVIVGPYVLAFGQLTIPERGVARVTWPILELYTPLKFSGMAEAKIVKFCAQGWSEKY